MKIPPWLSLQVVELAAMGGLVWLLAAKCDAESQAKARAAKADEAVELAKHEIQTAKEASEREMKAQENLAQRRLGEALAKAGIKGKTVFVATGSTGPVTVGGTPLPSGPGSAPGSSGGASSPSPAGRACVLYRGEHGEIRVSAAGVKTKAGNVAIDGQADAYALSPERHLFGGPLKLDVKVSPQGPDSRSAGWGVGAAVLLNGGLGGRLLVLPPPFLGFESFASIDVSRSGVVDRPALGVFRRF